MASSRIINILSNGDTLFGIRFPGLSASVAMFQVSWNGHSKSLFHNSYSPSEELEKQIRV